MPLLIYTIENLGKGVPPNTYYYTQLQETRNGLLQLLLALKWNPQRAWGPHAPRGPVAPLLAKQLMAQDQAMQRALREAEVMSLLQKQFEEFAKEQAKQAEAFQKLLREFAQEEDAVVMKQLRADEPMTRWLAVHLASKRRLPVEEDFIQLLADPHWAVAQAAHQALVRTTRGADFGPDPKASFFQIATSQRAWRDWLQLQTDSRFAVTAPAAKD